MQFMCSCYRITWSGHLLNIKMSDNYKFQRTHFFCVPLISRLDKVCFYVLALIITDIFVFLAYHGKQWITVCGPFHKNSHQITSMNFASDKMVNLPTLGSNNHLCLNVGLSQAEVSVPSIYFVMIGIDNVSPIVFKVCEALLMMSMLSLGCLPVAFVLITCTSPLRIFNSLLKEKLLFVLSAISFLLLATALILFITYKERKADTAPNDDLFKHMMNNFVASYGCSFFLAVTGLLCNGLITAFLYNMFRKSEFNKVTEKYSVKKKCNGHTNA